MPQVNWNKIKERASLLRNLGSTQVSKYLKSQVGKHHNILMESESMGRTEQFAEVDFQNPQQPGTITFAKIKKLNNNKLMV